MLNQFSFRAKLVILGVINLIVISMLAFTAYRSTTDLSGILGEQTSSSSILRALMKADMLHDVINSNVLFALNATSGKDVDPGVRSDTLNKLQEDRKALKDNIDILEKANIGDHAREVLTRIKPDIDRYLGSSDNVVTLSFQNHAAALAQLPHFTKLFGIAGKNLGELGTAFS